MTTKKFSQITVATSTPSQSDFIVGVAGGNTDTLYSTNSLRTPGVNTQTGTSYTLLSTDNGSIITLNNGGTITLTLPSGLGAGFSCLILQLGAGQVGVISGGGTTLNSLSGQTHLAGQYAMGTIIASTANNFVLGGQIT